MVTRKPVHEKLEHAAALPNRTAAALPDAGEAVAGPLRDVPYSAS
jgi:hypothetical protein